MSDHHHNLCHPSGLPHSYAPPAMQSTAGAQSTSQSSQRSDPVRANNMGDGPVEGPLGPQRSVEAEPRVEVTAGVLEPAVDTEPNDDPSPDTLIKLLRIDLDERMDSFRASAEDLSPELRKYVCEESQEDFEIELEEPGNSRNLINRRNELEVLKAFSRKLGRWERRLDEVLREPP